MRGIFLISCVVAALAVEPAVAQWKSSNLVTNGDFSNYLSGWTENPYGGWKADAGSYGHNYMAVLRENLNGWSPSTLSRSVSLEIGKRYAGRAYMSSGNVGVPNAYDCKVDMPIGSTGWIHHGGMTSYSLAEAIYNGGSSQISLSYRLVSGGEGVPTFDDISLWQVVYAPKLNISENVIRVNTFSPGGATAPVSLTLESDYADDPTSWNVAWGDGITVASPALRSTTTHTYSLSFGNSQTWTATFAGSNQAGSGQDTATVTVLRQPSIGFKVNGMLVQDGDTVTVNAADLLDMSLSESQGYIESGSLVLGNKLNQVGTDLDYSGRLFSNEDIGRTYSLCATIGNTGSGINSDTISLNVQVVPEPASLSLMALGGVILIRRRRRVEQ